MQKSRRSRFQSAPYSVIMVKHLQQQFAKNCLPYFEFWWLTIRFGKWKKWSSLIVCHLDLPKTHTPTTHTSNQLRAWRLGAAFPWVILFWNLFAIILFWNHLLWNIFCFIMKCICLNLFASILLSFVVILLNKQALNHLLYQAQQQMGSSCRYQQ